MTEPRPPSPLLLVLGGAFADPPRSGVERRRRFHAKTLASIAPTAIFVTANVDAGLLATMEEISGARVGCAPPEAEARGWVDRQRLRFKRYWLPHELVRNDGGRLEAAYRAFVADHELVLFHHVESYVLLRRALGEERVIVDLDDLEAVAARQRLRMAWSKQLSVSSSGRLVVIPEPARSMLIRLRRMPKLAAVTARTTVHVIAWRRAQRRAVSSCEAVLVCSHDDLRALGSVENGFVVPNSWPRPDPAHSVAAVRSSTTVAFWGPMSYGPNADGATWFARQVLPLLRHHVPNAQLLLIGRGGERLGLEAIPGVEITGFLDDLEPVLASVAVCVVPLRMGVGTRIKILEAWANRIPVVSTSVGAYGLDAVDGDEILIADAPSFFADQVARVLGDAELRQRMVERGFAKVQSFSDEQVAQRLREVVLQTGR